MEIWLREENIKQTKIRTKHQALQLAFQYLQQDFVRQISDFDAFREEYR